MRAVPTTNPPTPVSVKTKENLLMWLIATVTPESAKEVVINPTMPVPISSAKN